MQASPIDMIHGCEPGTSGRWLYASISSGNKNANVKATEFRSLLELKSMWFSVFKRGGGRETTGNSTPATKYTLTTAQAYSCSTEAVYNEEPRKESIGSKRSFVIGPGRPGPITFVFQGRGWGHGVGLSQWGAKAMAEQGAGYKQILMHYYPSTDIETWW